LNPWNPWCPKSLIQIQKP